MKTLIGCVFLIGVCVCGVVFWPSSPNSPAKTGRIRGFVKDRDYTEIKDTVKVSSAPTLRSVTRQDYEGLRNQILKGDIQSGAKLLEGLEGSAVKDGLAIQLVKAFSEEHGPEVLEWLMNLKPAALRGKCMVEFVGIQAFRNFALASRGVETLPFGAWRSGAVVALCSRKLDNEVLAWLDARDEPEDIADASLSLVEVLVHEQPSGLARLRDTLRSDRVRSVVAKAMGAACIEHPEQVSIMDSLEGTDRVDAVEAYVKRLGNVKPSEAAGYALQMPAGSYQRLLPDVVSNFQSTGDALEFVASIQNNVKRRLALDAVLKRWCRGNPDTALQELQTLGITPSAELLAEITGLNMASGNKDSN